MGSIIPTNKKWKNRKSAKYVLMKTKAELSEESLERNTKRGRSRYMVSDLCDICLEIRYVKRWQLALRVKNKYKFMCWDCHEMTGVKFGNNLILCHFKGSIYSNNKS